MKRPVKQGENPYPSCASSIFLSVVVAMLLASCATSSQRQAMDFVLQQRVPTQISNPWGVDGKISISGQQHLAATIQWRSTSNKQTVQLLGAFGQGRAFVELTQDGMVLDITGKPRQYFVGKQGVAVIDGVAMPFAALGFWLRGLPSPHLLYSETAQGFIQSSWQVQYGQMQWHKRYLVPRKITVSNKNTTIKLIIKQWQW